MVTHVFKDGTTTTEIKDVYVPKKMVEHIQGIVRKECSDETNQDQK